MDPTKAILVVLVLLQAIRQCDRGRGSYPPGVSASPEVTAVSAMDNHAGEYVIFVRFVLTTHVPSICHWIQYCVFFSVDLAVIRAFVPGF